MPILLSVHPDDEKYGEEALPIALASNYFQTLEEWKAGDRHLDGSLALWSGFSILVNPTKFETVAEMVKVLFEDLTDLEQHFESLRDSRAVRDMILFIHLSGPPESGVRVEFPKHVTRIAKWLRVKMQLHAADGSLLARYSP